jgi:hypothetical protein
MKVQIDNIVNQMSPEVRQHAEREATARGMSLDQFVQDQLSAQLTEQELTLSAAKIRFDRWNSRVDGGTGGGGGIRGGIGVSGRF